MTRSVVQRAGAVVDRVDAAFESRVATRSAAVVLIELFAGLGWARACVEKMIDGRWWRGETVQAFVAEHRGDGIAWYRPAVEGLVEVVPIGVASIVLIIEASLAVCLLRGRRLELVAVVGCGLLLQFLLAGATNPAVFYLVFHAALGLWAVEQRAPTPQLLAGLRWALGGCALLIVTTLPFAKAAAPAGAINDPALVASAWAGCVAVTALGARRRIRRRHLEAVTIDLRISKPTSKTKMTRQRRAVRV